MVFWASLWASQKFLISHSWQHNAGLDGHSIQPSRALLLDFRNGTQGLLGLSHVDFKRIQLSLLLPGANLSHNSGSYVLAIFQHLFRHFAESLTQCKSKAIKTLTFCALEKKISVVKQCKAIKKAGFSAAHFAALPTAQNISCQQEQPIRSCSWISSSYSSMEHALSSSARRNWACTKWSVLCLAVLTSQPQWGIQSKPWNSKKSLAVTKFEKRNLFLYSRFKWEPSAVTLLGGKPNCSVSYCTSFVHSHWWQDTWFSALR